MRRSKLVLSTLAGLSSLLILDREVHAEEVDNLENSAYVTASDQIESFTEENENFDIIKEDLEDPYEGSDPSDFDHDLVQEYDDLHSQTESSDQGHIDSLDETADEEEQSYEDESSDLLESYDDLSQIEDGWTSHNQNEEINGEENNEDYPSETEASHVFTDEDYQITDSLLSAPVEGQDRVEQGEQSREGGQTQARAYDQAVTSYDSSQTQRSAPDQTVTTYQADDQANYHQEFIDEIKGPAIQGWYDYGVLPSITVAQAILESGWGTSTLAVEYNNLFGVKGDFEGDSANLDTVEESEEGQYEVNDEFRAYPSWEASIEDHGRFLYENSIYESLIGDTDYVSVANKLQEAGYATDSSYASKLIQIIEDNQLYELDRIVIQGENPDTGGSDQPDQTSDDSNVYTVQPGDSLSSIAQQFDITIDQLLSWNGITIDTVIHPGDQLIVGESSSETTNEQEGGQTSSEDAETYIVQPGDSLWSISEQFGVSLDELLDWNNLTEDSVIHPGDEIIIRN